MTVPPPGHAGKAFPNRAGHYRARQRQRSHEAAHAADAPAAMPPVLDHPLVPAGKPDWIDDAAGLHALLDHLHREGLFAFDTEFIGENSYEPRLCLIQVATPGRIWLIDPLPGLDLKPFWTLLADETVGKLVHAGRQDFQIVVHRLGRPPQGVFDVQIGAGFAGLRYPCSLGELVRTLLQTDLNTGPKFSQWDRRPLSPVQMHYAANDVRYLPAMHALIVDQLETMGNRNFAEAACAELCDAELYQFDPASVRLRVRGIDQFDGQQQSVLRALLCWREAAAREADLPPRSLVKDAILVDLARFPVGQVRQLSQVRGLPRPVIQRFGQQIVQATLAALDHPMPPHPTGPSPRRGQAFRQRVDRLWADIQQACLDRGIDTGVVLSKREVSDHLQAVESGHPEASVLLQGWRHDLLHAALAPSDSAAASDTPGPGVV